MDKVYKDLLNSLKNRLGLPITDLNTEQSKFFKNHYKANFKNKGILFRE